MRISLTNAIDQYLKACKNTNWIAKEAYKFEFANFILQQVAWDAQSDEEILQTLIQSQKIKYSGADNARGIQFVQKYTYPQFSNQELS